MTNKKVLIVDDEPHMRTSLSVIVRRLGHTPTCAQNGSEALNLLVEQQGNASPFDLMLCDLQMPLITGEELVGRMKQRRIGTPVLIITGVGDKAGVVRLMRLGCRDFIDKPFSPEEIEQRINALLDDISSESAECVRKEYMARIGEMARATVHDINNVTGATMGYADMALSELGEQELVRDRLTKIVKTASRTADICRDLLSFDPAKSVGTKIKTDLNIVVERVAAMLKDVVPPNITITTGNRKTSLWLEADAWQLQHALLNLGFNAADAMPVGGEIALNLHDPQSEENSGSFVCITVSDNGNGIPKSVLPDIFNDGFSTKDKGYGIGLANIKRIVANHCGTIKVTSEVGKGTCFTILLPYNKN